MEELNSMTRICTFGTCVVSDIFNYTFPDRYQVKRFGRNKISTLLSDSIDLPIEFFDSLQATNFEKKMIANSFRNDVVQQILQIQPDYLVLDFFDEVNDKVQIDFNGKTFCLNDHWINHTGNWFNQIKESIVGKDGILPDAEVKRVPYLETPFSEIEKAYQDFVGKILKSETNQNGFEQEQIIVVESYPTEYFINNGGSLQPLPHAFPTKTIIDFLQKVYQLFYTLVPGCHRIKLPEYTYGNANHIWGPHPLHYHQDTYSYLSTAIDIITGYHPFRSTLEKLYREQSLENRLKARLLFANVIYEIPILKEKIALMERKVDNFTNVLHSVYAQNERLISILSEASSILETTNMQINSLKEESD